MLTLLLSFTANTPIPSINQRFQGVCQIHLLTLIQHRLQGCNQVLQTKKAPNQNWPEFEIALNDWVNCMEGKVPITGDPIKVAAQRSWNRVSAYQNQEVPRFSTGWLGGFKRRHKPRQYTYK